jgi:hypothetical protein
LHGSVEKLEKQLLWAARLDISRSNCSGLFGTGGIVLRDYTRVELLVFVGIFIYGLYEVTGALLVALYGGIIHENEFKLEYSSMKFQEECYSID